jgi:hypothetical protein
MVVGGRCTIASSTTQCSKVSFEATAGPVKEASEAAAAWQDIVLRASSKMKLVICKYWDGLSDHLKIYFLKNILYYL